MARADSQAGTLRGRSAIACARLVFAAWGEIHAGERWRNLSLREQGMDRAVLETLLYAESGLLGVSGVSAQRGSQRGSGL